MMSTAPTKGDHVITLSVGNPVIEATASIA